MTLDRVELGEGYLGSAFFTLRTPDFTRNAFNVAHGGALTTYVDIATTAALYGFDSKQRTNVSAKLDMEFLNASQVGQELEIEARINRIGKGLAFTEGRIADAKTK